MEEYPGPDMCSGLLTALVKVDTHAPLYTYSTNLWATRHLLVEETPSGRRIHSIHQRSTFGELSKTQFTVHILSRQSDSSDPNPSSKLIIKLLQAVSRR